MRIIAEFCGLGKAFSSVGASSVEKPLAILAIGEPDDVPRASGVDGERRAMMRASRRPIILADASADSCKPSAESFAA